MRASISNASVRAGSRMMSGSASSMQWAPFQRQISGSMIRQTSLPVRLAAKRRVCSPLNTETWQREPCTVSTAFATGYNPVYKMTPRLGRTIRTTANHLFLTLRGWQRLDTFSPGDRIATLAQSDVYWDEIIAIKPDGEA